MKLLEKDIEDLIANNPEKYIGEAGLKLMSRQYSIGPYRFDLLFEDRHGGKLIVEIQRKTLDRNHTYKILDYYDEYKERHPNEFVELMVIANRIPIERRKRLSSIGVSFKEISEDVFLKDLSFRDNQLKSAKSDNLISINKSQGKVESDRSLIDEIRYQKPDADYLDHIDIDEKVRFIEKLDSLLLKLDPEITKKFLKKHIMYYKGEVGFGYILPQRNQIKINPRLVKYNEIEDPKNYCQDKRQKILTAGGEIRVLFKKPYNEADYALFLLKQSLAKA